MIQYFMKQYLFLLWGITSLIFSSLFLACSDDEPGDKTPVFTIKEEYLQQDFDQKQSSLVIPVETNLAADAWVVSSNQDWCVAAKDMSGSSPAVKVLVHANEEPDVRSAEITLKSSVQNYTIQVRQLGYGPAILVKNPNPIIDAAGGPLSIIVTSNIYQQRSRKNPGGICGGHRADGASFLKIPPRCRLCCTPVAGLVAGESPVTAGFFPYQQPKQQKNKRKYKL